VGGPGQLLVGKKLMKPIHKILVPTDFSEHSAHALEYAVDLARRYDDSHITLAHVYPVVNYAAAEGFALYTPEQLADLLTKLAEQLKAEEDRVHQLGWTRIDTTLLQGDAYKETLELAAGYDLIVMGTHGRTGFKHALIGSVAEKLVRTAPCPVLTVRKHPA
jgi:nucleotide-binding universal stress UspA family protein